MLKLSAGLCRVAFCAAVFLPMGAWAQPGVVVGPNVNMVSGVSLADGDPFLTKQNEPSMAVSSVNALHLLAGSNDYRLVDLAQSLDNPGGAGDSWLGLYKSLDGGRTWRSTVLSGCPLNIAACNSPLASSIKGLQFGSDPTVRPGPYGTIFYSFIAGNRGTGASGVIGIQRFFDMNNNVKLSDDPFRADKMNIVDTGTSGQFLDKPWNVADTPARPWNGNATCVLPNYAAPVPAFNVYVVYSNFVGQSQGNQHPQILVAVSNDCGNTFQKPKKVSQSLGTNSGAVATIDPKDGTVYVVWREFAPDAIYVSKSSDGGNTWSNNSLVAQINPFDQGTSGVSFRTNAFPTAAVSVDAAGKSRLHVAWSQRGVGPVHPGSATSLGAARIVLSTSTDGGAHWSSPAAVDNSFQTQTVPYAYSVPPAGSPIGWSSFNTYNPAGYGHQIQPSLTFAAGKLALVWLDQRMDETAGVLQCPPEDPNHPFQIGQCVEMRVPNVDSAGNPLAAAAVFNDQISDSGLTRRHTLDVFGGEAIPQDSPVFATKRVSQYLFGSKSVAAGSVRTRQTIRQIRFNVPNLPIYVNGTATFIGDYIDVAAQQMMPTGDPAHPYAWNVSAANKTVFHGTWTDNRDINAPKDGNWQNYTPIKLLGVDANGNATVGTNSACVPGQEGMKNQNLYTATIFEGVDAYAVVNARYLNGTTPRPFNIVVQNATAQAGTFQLAVASLPPGTAASFKLPFIANGGAPPPPVILSIPPFSSATRTLWVTSTNPGATITVNLNSVNPDGSNPVALTAVVLNPDSSATAQNNGGSIVDVSNNNQSDVTVTNTPLSNNDLTNVAVPNNDLTNNDLTNNDLTNNDLTNNDLTNSAILNNDLTNNDLTNNDLTNNDLTNNDLTNNDLTNNDLTNAGLADSTFTLFNNGTSDVALNLKTLTRGSVIPPNYKLQLIVRKLYTTQVPNPLAVGTCGYAKVQQSVPVMNVPHPGITSPTDPTISQFLTDSSDTPTVPLLPQETARVTYRLVYTPPPPAPGQPPATLGDTQPLALEFGANGIKLVAVNASTNIVPIPLVIETLDLPPATVGQAYSSQLLVNGGLGTKTWVLAPGSTLPGGFSLSASGLLSYDPSVLPVPNSYQFTVQVTDQTTPNSQSDKQTLTLVLRGVQHLAFPAAQLTYGGSVTLATSTDAGLPVTYSLSGSCTLSGATLTAASGTGTCLVNATQPGNSIYLPLAASQTFNLNKAPLTITANDASVIYGGVPVFSSSVTGLIGTDTAASLGTITYATSATLQGGQVTSPVGSYSITPGGIGSLNYNPTYKSGTLTVTKAPLTVTADNQAMTYGGTVPTLTGSLIGVQNSDPITATYTTTATSTSAAGQYAIVPALADPLGKLGNYSLVSNNGLLTIGKAALSVTAADASRGYGAANPVFTGTILGLVNGDPITATYASAATTASSVGPYPIVATLSDPAGKLGNYALTNTSGTLTITKALLSVTAADASRTYGAANPTFSGSITGIQNGDNITATYTSAGPASPVGTYPIVPALSDPSGKLGNYAVTLNNGTLTVTKAPLSVTPADASRTYGAANPAFSGTITGIQNSDNITATYATAAVSSSAAGTYSITASLVDPGGKLGNYTLTSNNGTLTITKAALTVTPASVSRPYGAANPLLTGTIAGIQNGDPITATYATTAVATSAIGTYPITATLADPGAKLANYSVTFNPASLTVTAAGLTVTPANATRQYGTANPSPLTGAITGIQNGDAITATYSTTATTASPVGGYLITATLSGPIANYSVTLNTGTLSVTRAPLTVAAVNASKVFGDPLPAFAITSAGYLLTDTAQSVLTGTLVIGTTATATSDVGTYPISVGGLSAANYTITFVPGTLTITQAQPVFTNLTSSTIPAGATPTALSGSIAYNSIAPSGSVSITLGGVAQAAAITAGGAFSASFATGGLASGSYPIGYSYPGDKNFKSAAGSGTLGVAGFQATGSMSAERSFHTATLLPSGKVLVAGGFNKTGSPIASGEVYDPATRTFSATQNNMPNKAVGHTATLLGNGKVLVVGGGNSSSQLYDPATNSWSSGGGSGVRSYHTATLLQNGKVLIAGGSDNSGKALNSAILYDPATGSFTSTGNMSAAREFHTANLLPDGTVLIAGGRASSGNSFTYLNSAEIYNPATGAFSASGNMSSARYAHSAVMYNNRILIVGGSSGGATALATAELYDPATRTFTGTGSMAATQGRQYFTATMAGSGVLAAGGLGGTTTLSSAEQYQSGTFSPAGSMTTARSAHTATPLNDGSILITGGKGSSGNSVATAELYKTP